MDACDEKTKDDARGTQEISAHDATAPAGVTAARDARDADATVVAALYRFAPLAEPRALIAPLLACATRAGVKGTLLVAGEGINGTIAGSAAAIGEVLAAIRAVPGLADIDVRYARARGRPFARMKVKLKREIVTMGVDGIDPLRSAGRYVAPEHWNALLGAPGTLLIDTRNAYEVAIGTFAGAVDPATRSFRQFPAWIAQRLAGAERPERIAMFCTGGIRCEKATAFVRQLGFEEVYHLKGGILAYLERVAEAESLWRGECYVFDERVAVGHALAQGSHTLCRRCGSPVRVEAGTGGGYAGAAECGCGG